MYIKNETILKPAQLASIFFKIRGLRKVRYMAIAFLIIFLPASIYTFVTMDSFVNPASGFSLFSLIILFSPFIVEKRLNKTMGGQPSQNTYLFKDDVLEVSVKNATVKVSCTTYPYESISGFDVAKDYILIYVGEYNFLYVDRKGFSSESELNEVLSHLKETVKK